MHRLREIGIIVRLLCNRRLRKRPGG